jgi:hypothetical protein
VSALSTISLTATSSRARASPRAPARPLTGDGFNDICAALALSSNDVLLARSGYPLAQYLAESQGNAGLPRVAAQTALWANHEELLAHVRAVVDV